MVLAQKQANGFIEQNTNSEISTAIQETHDKGGISNRLGNHALLGLCWDRIAGNKV